ncbi:MAG: isocitrate/isopropylmalate family dehydrogenase [Planctomycetota bacterium]|nr:isocitrate/isopropylmalate family dehydrogenase [Planctomycetota bacterium]
MDPLEITELQGDGIGPELQRSVHKVARALPLNILWREVDWSLDRRESEGDAAMAEAEAMMRATQLALKYPTITWSQSPNALIRRRVGFSVIHRPAISIPGVDSLFKERLNIHIVRVATGGTYDDPGRLAGPDAAVSIRLVEREPCAQAASFAFELARKLQSKEGEGHVTSSSKWTIQKATDGLFEETVEEVSHGYPDIEHQSILFDAMLGKIVIAPDAFNVVVTLNEYGDFLSDMASGLVGSMGTGASGNFAFDDHRHVTVAMFDPAGGTAPDIAGQDICNPTAVLLAFGMLLDHIDRYDIGHALRLSVLGAIKDGECTKDLKGSLSTTEFTQVIIDRLPDHLPE